VTGETLSTSGPPSKKRSRNLSYDSQRVIVGVVGPTPTFISHHTHILKVIFSPLLPEGQTSLQPLNFTFSGPPDKKRFKNLNYDSERVIVGAVGQTPTFIPQHTHILKVIFSPVVTGRTNIPPATQVYIFWTPFQEVVQKSELR
jgi:hypothetical protein